jgi:hypothetical protein
MMVTARPGRFNIGQRTLKKLQTGDWLGHGAAQNAAKRKILLLTGKEIR